MEPEVFNLFFETKDDSQKQVAVTPKRKLIPYVLGMLGCVVAVVLFLALRLGGKQTELGYTAKNDSILDETRFIRVSENQEKVEYSLKKGNSPEEVALSALPKKLKRQADYQGKPLRIVNFYIDQGTDGVNSLDIETYHLTNEQRLGLDPILHLGSGIPFYILIDKDGVIVDFGEHLRPSIPETREIIDNYLLDFKH